MQFHPKDIPRHEICEIYYDLCKETLVTELGSAQFTIAYSRPTTIGSVIAKSDLYQVEGKDVRKYIVGELWVISDSPSFILLMRLLCSHLWGG